jgi:hypothetical protein
MPILDAQLVRMSPEPSIDFLDSEVGRIQRD